MTGSWVLTLCITWLLMTIWNPKHASGEEHVTIDAAFNNEQGVVLISGDQQLQIDGTKRAEVGVRPLGNNFLVQAAWKTKETGDNVFLYGQHFGQVFNLNYGAERKLYYEEPRAFIKHGGPDAAGKKGGTVYFFKGCEMAVRNHWDDWGDAQDVQSIGLPCSPDAAWSDGNDMILLKGDQIWRWTDNDKVFGPCPFSDSYSISSWELGPSPFVQKRVCADGWRLHCASNKCYQLFRDWKNFDFSALDCKDKGGNLATIRNEHEQKTVEALTADELLPSFIGLNDKAQEGKHTWLSESQPAGYTNWALGQPSDLLGVEDCVEIHGKLLAFKWDDVTCLKLAQRICERPAVLSS